MSQRALPIAISTDRSFAELMANISNGIANFEVVYVFACVHVTWQKAHAR
jgi:hypothetical protein